MEKAFYLIASEFDLVEYSTAPRLHGPFFSMDEVYIYKARMVLDNYWDDQSCVHIMESKPLEDK